MAVSLTDDDLILIVSCLLNRSPNLHELITNGSIIQLFFVESPVCYAYANFLSDTLTYAQDDYNGIKSETDDAYWERHQVTNCMMHHLCHVKLDDVNSAFFFC